MEILLATNFPVLAGALLKSIWVTAVQMVAFLGIFVVLGFLIDRMEQKRNRWLRASVGTKGIYATALIGVPVHEMGHALMCWLFGHKVEQIKLVQFGAPDGTMGYVNHSYDTTNLFHRIGLFFIGIAPIVMGIVFISVSLYFTLPDTFGEWKAAVVSTTAFSGVFSTAWQMISSLFAPANLVNPLFYLFLVLAISVASHMTLSPSDIVGARSGLVTIYAVAVIFNLLFLAMNGGNVDFRELFLNGYNVFMLSVSAIAILFSAVATGIAYLLYFVKGRQPSGR